MILSELETASEACDKAIQTITNIVVDDPNERKMLLDALKGAETAKYTLNRLKIIIQVKEKTTQP